MTYAQGGLIEASDFNNIAANTGVVWSGAYGQPTIGGVTVGQAINHTEWNNVYTAVANSAAHQGTTIVAIPAAVAGAPVTFYPQLANNIANVTSNVYNAATVGASVSNSGTRTTNWGANAGLGTVTSNVAVVFANSTAASTFFKSGGIVRVQTAKTGVTTPVDIGWVELCANIGTLGLPWTSAPQTIAGASYTGLSQFGNSGPAPTILTHNGYANLTATPAILFRQFSAPSTYTSDRIDMNYSVTGSTLTIQVQFVDTNIVSVTGTLTVTATAVAPETTYLANTWGTPVVTVTAPA